MGIKISVLTTAPSVRNYGAVFQAYATERLLREAGFEAEFVNYFRPALNTCGPSVKEILSALQTRNFFQRFPTPVLYLFALSLLPSIKNSIRAFEPFIRERIPSSRVKYCGEEELRRNPPLGDIYCTGGDQMWNEQHNGHKTPRVCYLTWAPNDKPKVSFSTSVGKRVFDDWELPEVLPLLREYSAISVREDETKTMLEKLGIPSVTHLLDPVLLMPSAAWEALSAPQLVGENYILIYEMSKRDFLSRYARRLAKVTGMPVVRIIQYDMERLQIGRPFPYPTPEEFLSLFRYASAVVTNSFHGTAFSILFHRNLLSVPGSSSFSMRLTNVLRSLNMENCICENWNDVGRVYADTKDFQKADELLEAHRENARAFLEKIRALV